MGTQRLPIRVKSTLRPFHNTPDPPFGAYNYISSIRQGQSLLEAIRIASNKRSLDFQRDLLSCLRPVPCNEALQRAPDEA